MADLCKDFDKLPFEYQEETKKLCENLDAVISLNEKRNLFESFTKNYIMLPALWQKWLQLERENTGTCIYNFKNAHLFAMEQKALNDFYYYKFMEEKDPYRLSTADFWFFKILDTYEQNCYAQMYREKITRPKDSQRFAEMFLNFPHRDIEGTFNVYRQLSLEPIPKSVIEKYKYNKNLYNQIMSANKNDEKWVELIFSVKDFDFIRQNIEARIAENPANKDLWKYFISYLKDYPENIQILLSVYYRYCRLFIDDDEMKAEFKQLELKEKRIEPKILIPTRYSGLPNVRTKFTTYFDNYVPFKPNFANQCFPFQTTIVAYVMENSSAEIWQKLYQTCKYLFYKKQIPIIHQLRVVSGYTSVVDYHYSSSSVKHVYAKCIKQSSIITEDVVNLEKIKNPILSNYLNIPRCASPDFLSNLISSLHSSQIKFLVIGLCKITIDELDFLVGHGKVEVAFLNCEIIDTNGDEYIPIEELVARFPYGWELKISFAKYNQNSAEKLVKLQRLAKLEQFKISRVTADFNVVDYINFVSSNTLPLGIFDVTFVSTVPEDTVTAFKNTVEQTFANCEMELYFTIKKA